MNDDASFPQQSSSDQLLYNAEQLLSTKKNLRLLDRAEWRLRMRLALARKTYFESGTFDFLLSCFCALFPCACRAG